MHSTHHPSITHVDLVDVTPADVLRGAARYLELHGWTRYDYFAAKPTIKVPFPAACAHGAISVACYGRAVAHPFEYHGPELRLFKHAMGFFDDYLDVSSDEIVGPLWNDRDGRTVAEVVKALRDAADDYDRTHPRRDGAR